MGIAVVHRDMKNMPAMQRRRARQVRSIMVPAMLASALLIAPARPAHACDPYTDPTCFGPTTPRSAAALACQDPCGKVTAACTECWKAWKASAKPGESDNDGAAICGKPGEVFPPDGSGCHP